MMSFFVLTFFFVNGEAFAQTGRINANLAMPVLDIENGAKTSRVRINTTATECEEAFLVLNVPEGFRYIEGSAKVGTDGLTEAVDGNKVRLTLGTIPASSPEYIEVLYDLEALCPALGLKADDRVVTYELHLCGADPEVKKSNVINLQAAVLNLTVTPTITVGLIGDEIVRTITVTNSGTAGIANAKINVNYGAGIELVSNEASLPAGLQYSESGYVYENNLPSGGSITFTETVKIVGCGELESNYNVFYGDNCNGGATDNTLGKATTIVRIDDTKRPNVTIIDESADGIVCMGGSFVHTWRVKNTGNAPASAIRLEIGASTIDSNVVKLTGGDGSVVDKIVSINRLEPGEERVITFTQNYASPAAGVDCSSLPAQYSTESTSYTLAYIHKEGCIDGKTPSYTSSGTTKGSLSFAFAGDNVGEADIQGGRPYQADFKIGTWSFPEAGLSPDAYLEIAIELSPNLSLTENELKLFNGASDVGVEISGSGTSYIIKVLRAALISGGEGNWRLKFPLALNCPTTDEPFYKITSTLHNCESEISFTCETVSLNGHCPTQGDCPDGGMQHGEMSFQRITLGLADADNDGKPESNNPATGLGESIRSFVAGDIVEIAQRGVVIAPVGEDGTTREDAYLWNNGGRFVVSLVDDANLGLSGTDRVGKVVVTRGTETIRIDNIPVQSENGKFYIELPTNATDFIGFQTGDVVVASLQLKATKGNEKTGLKRFSTEYWLKDADNAPRSCGGGYYVNGYYGATQLSVGAVSPNYNLPTCSSGENGAGLMVGFSIIGNNFRNALFPDEFREIAKPKSVSLIVSSGLILTGYRVELLGNGASPTFIDIKDLNVSGSTHVVSAETLKGYLSALKGNNAFGVIDEGFTFILRPIVTPKCGITILTETIKVIATADGSFHYNGTDYIDAKDVSLSEQTLTYHTDNDKINVEVIQASTIAYTNEAEWLVRVTNRSNFRGFENFWLKQFGDATAATISRVREITSLGNTTTPPGGIVIDAASNYDLGKLDANESRYFMVTATLAGCNSGAVEFSYGTSCKAIPDEACEEVYKDPLTFQLVNPILQTTVLDDPGTGPLSICEPITYVIEVNNAGGEAKDLRLKIDMVSFLEYLGEAGQDTTTARMSGVYKTRPGSVGDIIFEHLIEGIVLDLAANSATIIIPAAHLPKDVLQNAERFYLRFQLGVKNCEFKSGQTITLTPAAKNFCGVEAEGESQVMEAGTERIILKGAPGDLPVVDLGGGAAANLTPSTASDVLTATYTAMITNIGGDVENHPITGIGSSTVYKYALKLPSNWVIDAPQSGVGVDQLKYVEEDLVKGYVFEFNKNLTHLDQIALSFQLRYIGDVSEIACADPNHTFGNILQEVYALFEPEIDDKCDPDKFKDCTVMELLIKDQSIPFNLTQSSPTGDEQAFCIDGSTPTLNQVVLGNRGIVEWYYDAGLANKVADPSTEDMYARYKTNGGVDLVNGEIGEIVYYTTNRLVDGSDCLSPATAVRIVLEANPLSEAGVDQLKYNTGAFTLAANKPARSTTTNTGSKGVWTVVSATGNIADVNIANSTLFNSNVTIPVGTTATLRWTVTNTCEFAVDDVTLVSKKATLELTKEQVGDVADKDGDDRHSKGDEIQYQFVIKNTGDVAIKAPFTIVDANLEWTGHVIPKLELAELAPGASFIYGETSLFLYSITQEDMNKGEVINTAKVTGKTPEIPTGSTDFINIPSNEANIRTELVPETGLSLIKSVTKIGGNSAVGDEITYTFTVTNTGNVTVNTLQLTDAKLDLPNASFNFSPASIDPGKTSIGTRKYTLTQADLDRGYIDNTASITGTPANGDKPTDVSDTGTDRKGNKIDNPELDGDDDPTILDLIQTPGIKLTKVGVYQGDKDRAEVEDKVVYTFVVTNTGNVTLKDVVLTDTDFSGEGIPLAITGPTGNPAVNTAASLAPKATLTYTATYTLTQEDIDAGILINQAAVEAVPPVGLDPDIPLQPVNDLSNDPTNPDEPNDKTIVDIPQNPLLSLIKSSISVPGFRYAGDVIEYEIVVTNTGNVTIKNIVITDDNADIGSIMPATINELKVGESVNITAKHTITQADMLVGYVSNIAKAVGKDPNNKNVTGESKSGNPVDPNDPTDPNCADCTITPLPWPEIVAEDDILPSVNGKDGSTNAGNVLVDNTNGDDTLNGIPTTTTEVNITVKTPASPVDPANLNTNVPVLGPLTGQVSVPENTPAGTYEIEYTICEKANPDNCSTATVTIEVEAAEIVAEDDRATGINGVDGADDVLNIFDNDTLNGEEIIPTEVVLSAGGGKVTDPVSFLDENGGPTNNVVLDKDGKVHVLAGTPAGTYTLPYSICEDLNKSNCDDALITIEVEAAPIVAEDDGATGINGVDGENDVLNIFKNDTLNGEEIDPSDVILSAGGGKITDPVSFLDENGNLTNNVVLDKDGNVHVLPGTLAGKYTLPYSICEDLNKSNCDDALITIEVDLPVIKAEDDDLGSINGDDGSTNAGNVLDNNGSGRDTYNNVDAKIETVSINVINPANPIDPANSNTNVPILDPLTGQVSVPANTPGGTYTIDYEICDRINVGNCSPATVTIFVEEPRFTLDKTGVLDADGDTIEYRFVVTNTGNVRIDKIEVIDTKPGMQVIALDKTSLEPNEVATGTAIYTVTLDEKNEGLVVNRAKVYGEDPSRKPLEPIDSNDPNHPTDPDNPTIVIVPQHPSIILEKGGKYFDSNGDGTVNAGDVINYSFKVTNTGNVTVRDIRITDIKIAVNGSAITLNPGESDATTFTGTYTITQADMDKGGVYNIATSTGKDPKDRDVTATSKDPNPLGPADPNYDPNCPDCTYTPIDGIVDIALVKTVTNAGSAANGLFVFGDAIEYSFVITNTGSKNLTSITLNDPLLTKGVISIPGSLAPGASFTHKEMYTITLEDIQLGKVVNSAVAKGKDPQDKDVQDVSGSDINNDDPTVTIVGEGPKAKNDQETTWENTPVVIEILDNDEEGSAPIDPESVTITKQPEHGTVTVHPDGTVTYTPNEGYSGEDDFKYTVKDKNGVVSNEAEVKLTIGKTRPVAKDDRAETEFNKEVKIPVLENDKGNGAELDRGTIVIKEHPRNGTVRVNGDGTVTYIPNPGYTGDDHFTYTVKDMNGNETNVAYVDIEVTGFFIPNVFTPNGDGNNDVFEIVGLDKYERAEVVIFNRWGNEVYRNKSYKNNWDGSSLNEGTYYYLITLIKEGKESVYKGWVLLKR